MPQCPSLSVSKKAGNTDGTPVQPLMKPHYNTHSTIDGWVAQSTVVDYSLHVDGVARRRFKSRQSRKNCIRMKILTYHQ